MHISINLSWLNSSPVFDIVLVWVQCCVRVEDDCDTPLLCYKGNEIGHAPYGGFDCSIVKGWGGSAAQILQ